MAEAFMANTDSMREIHRSLENNYKEFDEKETRLYKVIDNLSSVWDGEDAREYIKKINDFKPNVDELKEQIEEFAKLINANASDIDDMVAKIKSSMS